ncbi:S-phase kinase-associated protein 2 isoform X1 [Perognathus longimembris pacificus]|uniref:S-phase kinase-associated protein 2 isoform X1 n=3 Tax=Perognathus longimembris pacificus TaxID=214514 RepID=UPI00201988DE|nr:S-phase kinase-associated protein 2 isoform X1 [Perognathus longimembris pacificus]
MNEFKTLEPEDAMHRKHLQEIPDQSSNVTTSFTWGWDSSKTSELLSGMGVSTLEKEDVDSENIPQELLPILGRSQSPQRKRHRSKGNDKDFVIMRRPKLNRETCPGVSWDCLPDELLLGIFNCLCLPELLRVSGVCKRWYCLAFDESLWQSLDLTGRNLHPDVTARLLSRGVIAFRCQRSFMEQPLVEHFSSLRVQHMDLSNSVINVSALHGILSECFKLQNLSLEGLQLSDPIVNQLAQNSNLVRLNLCGCWGFSESALKTLLSSCSRLDELNLSWCFEFTEKHVQAAVAHVSKTVTQLNLSGYRKNLQKSDLCTLIRRCPNLVHLDLSDSIMLKTDCFPEFFHLGYLQHLSLSRCYDIIPETLLELGEIPTLKTLQVFGIVPDDTLQLLREALPHLQINCAYFTTIARPTIASQKNQEIWGIKCRLALTKPNCL